MRFYFVQEREREREREKPTIALALIRFGVKQCKSSWCDGETNERDTENGAARYCATGPHPLLNPVQGKN
jgi:hypothetical protein